MDNKTNNWIIGRELSRDYDNLNFLYKSLVKNVKKHRKWVHQDIKDDSQSTKDSILLKNSSSDLTPNFGGTILFVNDQELLPKTEAKVIRLGTFFPDEFDYSNEIPLITLNPNNVLIDQLPNSNDSKNILLIRGKKENEKYKNILNALENLPKTTSIQLKSFVEDDYANFYQYFVKLLFFQLNVFFLENKFQRKLLVSHMLSIIVFVKTHLFVDMKIS